MSDQDIDQFFASAIKLDAEQAPAVVASGHGDLGKLIERTARHHNIPVLQNFALSQRLSTISSGDDIPDILLFAISEVLKFVQDVERDCTQHQ